MVAFNKKVVAVESTTVSVMYKAFFKSCLLFLIKPTANTASGATTPDALVVLEINFVALLRCPLRSSCNSVSMLTSNDWATIVCVKQQLSNKMMPAFNIMKV
jgi:hypothetical protein